MTLPENHQAVMPYLIVKDGEAFEAFTQSVFDARLLMKHMRGDGNQIMHAEILISGSTLMFSEATAEYPVAGCHLFVYVQDADVSFEKAKQAGGRVVQELVDRPYGRSAGIDDGQGNTWWITSQLGG